MTLEVFDKELLILLINQRSLFLLSQTKWPSLEVVADWLVTKVNVKRIYLRNNDTKPTSANINSVNITRARSASTAHKPNNKFLNEENMIASKTLTLSNSSPSEENQVNVELEKHESLQMILEVILNRSVSIERTAFLQWRSRKVPRLQGLICKLTAYQESETLVFHAHLKVYIYIYIYIYVYVYI